MGKFAGPYDTGYKRVAGEIKRWLDKLSTKQGENLPPVTIRVSLKYLRKKQI
jgi:hypothetical protein